MIYIIYQKRINKVLINQMYKKTAFCVCFFVKTVQFCQFIIRRLIKSGCINKPTSLSSFSLLSALSLHSAKLGIVQ